MDIDVIRIKKVLSDIGIEVTEEEADELWAYYSLCLMATWIGLPLNDHELLKVIIEIVEEQTPEGYGSERPGFFNRILEQQEFKTYKEQQNYEH